MNSEVHMTNPFLSVWDNFNYATTQYTNMWDASVKVSSHAMQVYSQAWQELFFAPQTLFKRNLDFFQEVTTPPLPDWRTTYVEVPLPPRFAAIIKLLDFSLADQPDNQTLVPTLVLPPQAGHHSYIADYSVEQSQVQTLAQSGLTRIYCVEWLSATPQTSQTSIEDYIEALRYCIKQIGGKANLVGDCQGGWLAAIYAAIHPNTVHTLSVAGAPIDFQAGDGGIKQAVNLISKSFPDDGMSFYRKLVEMGGGVLNGNFLIGGFNVMKPEQLPERYLDLYENVHDPMALKRYREMKNWYDAAQDISGTFYLWLVEHLFRDNELILGRLQVGGQTVDLKRISCPVFLLAGDRDHITPADQVFNMAYYISTPPDQIHKLLVKAGHIGLFMGKEPLAQAWLPLGQKVAALSRHCR